jgi:cellobiose phosphorylase
MKTINSRGLSFEFLENGSVRCIEAPPVRLSLKPATPYSGEGANLFLRRRVEPFDYTPLLGPGSNSRFSLEDGRFMASGSWEGIEYVCMLYLSDSSLSWQWIVELKNVSGASLDLDMIFLQDVGLKTATTGLINEYYVSQYLERRILEDSRYGSVVCCRQNMKESGGNPWLMIACGGGAVAASVDGMQFYGRTCRETKIPEGLLAETLGGEYSGESSVAAIQEKLFRLASGANHRSLFAATYIADHPEATSYEDLKRLPTIMAEFPADVSFKVPEKLATPRRNIFNTSPFLKSDDLGETDIERLFGSERRHRETENGKLLSFFYGRHSHVVLRSKEIIVDRPHAHIIQAKRHLVPSGETMSTTSFACGIFNSHITQGNTNFNTLLSVCTSAFNLSPETGQRIFVNTGGGYRLLGVPSAFEMGLNYCRWIFKSGDQCLQVRTWTSLKHPQINIDFRVLSGSSVDLLITNQFDDTIGWDISAGQNSAEYVAIPREGSMIASKFPGARFRIKVNSEACDFRACGNEALYDNGRAQGDSLFVLDVRDTRDFCISFIGEVSSAATPLKITDAERQWLEDSREADEDWRSLSLSLSLDGDHKDIAAIREILPWYGMNALTHYLTPYGPEQFSGAAWGTRDVSQGPFDLLLCMGKYEEAGHVLRMIFSNQNRDGGWPQWWMFDRYTEIRADDSHGDVYYWCIMALASYIKVTGDLGILEERLPYHNQEGGQENRKTPLSEHVERLINMIIGSFIPGTSLVPFGGGDWNDSLQPVSKDLARRMISAWTVEMNYQAFMQYRKVYEQAGMKEKADALNEVCKKIRADFNRYLVRDGVVAGYGLVEADGTIGVLLHPSDSLTGISYSLLPMNRGIISGLFTGEQAERHQDLIEQHLKGPDGARLMDRPLRYRGGIQRLFQRAESSTFFGREIGLMYVHEHIRYAEALSITGKAVPFVKALRQAIPVAYSEVVPCGAARQSNCYYSSSDVTFRNRYEADELYDQIRTGRITVRGGWRVYSSGPGIYIGIIVSRLLGLRSEPGNVIIDPVLPFTMDGLSASLNFLGHSMTIKYLVKDGNYSPRSVSINGNAVKFVYEDNKYRRGGAVIQADDFIVMLNRQVNLIEVLL